MVLDVFQVILHLVSVLLHHPHRGRCTRVGPTRVDPTVHGNPHRAPRLVHLGRAATYLDATKYKPCHTKANGRVLAFKEQPPTGCTLLIDLGSLCYPIHSTASKSLPRLRPTTCGVPRNLAGRTLPVNWHVWGPLFCLHANHCPGRTARHQVPSNSAPWDAPEAHLAQTVRRLGYIVTPTISD